MTESPQKLNELHLFAGCGGGILGGILLGHHPVCAVEIEPYCRQVLLQRQRDGVLPRFPVWDDVRTFDGKPWRGRVDVVCGGFPCQDISSAGKGAGIGGARSGLWGEMARIVCEVEPRYVFVENSPNLVIRGLGRVLGDLAEMGYDAKWGVLGACDVGAPHERARIWILGFKRGDRAADEWGNPSREEIGDRSHPHSNGNGLQADTDEGAICESARDGGMPGRLGKVGCPTIWTEPRPAGARPMGVGNGVAFDVDRIKAAGNGQVPSVAALAWRILSNRISQ